MDKDSRYKRKWFYKKVFPHSSFSKNNKNQFHLDKEKIETLIEEYFKEYFASKVIS